MPPTLSRWFVPGSLGVNTAFDEPTDAPTPLSVAWATVGSAICHEGGDTLNLLESGPPENTGPELNWWGLNVSKKAVHLAALTARFSSAQDGHSSAYLSLSTKAEAGGLVEALRVTEQQALAIPRSISVGPVSTGPATGRIEASGASGEFSFLRRSLASWPTAPAAGDRFVWYNPDGAARLWTEASGDLLTVRANGDTTLAGAVSVPHVFQWFHNGLGAARTGWLGFGFGPQDSSLTLTNEVGRVHIAGAELLYLLNKSGVIVGREWGGTGDLSVEGTLFAKGTLLAEGNLRIGPGGTDLRGLQVGTQSVGNSGARVKPVTVGFGRQFAGTPRVIAVVRGDGRRNLSDTFTVSVTDVTPTEFAANICRVDAMGGWGQVVELDWMAWE